MPNMSFLASLDLKFQKMPKSENKICGLSKCRILCRVQIRKKFAKKEKPKTPTISSKSETTLLSFHLY
jgi:hypothetical protein